MIDSLNQIIYFCSTHEDESSVTSNDNDDDDDDDDEIPSDNVDYVEEYTEEGFPFLVHSCVYNHVLLL